MLSYIPLIMVDSADYQTLREELGVSYSLLSKHAGILAETGYLKITKEFDGRTQITRMSLTRQGREAFQNHLDAEIQRLLQKRQDEIKKASPATSDMDLELLSRWLITKVQRLEDENLVALEGRLRAPHIMPGMVPIMINDDGYCTQLVIHFDADHFQGMVGVSLEE